MNHSAAGRVLRRVTSTLAASALAAGGLVGIGATASPAQAAPVQVTEATFVWGLSGYAQRGIFGPWTFKDFTGDAALLSGSVSTPPGSQTEYAVQPIPATSMQPSTPQKTPNAVKFSGGTGTTDLESGETTLSWTGSYTVNAYPAMYNAPNEIYSDPQLALDEDGSGTLTMNFALGAGVDMNNNPTPAQDLGRVPLMTFEEGEAQAGEETFRLTPEYQGVEVTFPEGEGTQTRSCSTDNDATGWWGSWPQEFVEKVPTFVRPHFYSTGCTGFQDNKPPLPADFALNLAPEQGQVTVSDTTLLPNGSQQVTVTGTGFDPTLAIGATGRPPFAGKQSGTYIAFGRYPTAWRPSEGVTSGRTNPAAPNGNGVAVKWAVPTASFDGSGQDPTSPAYTELKPDGSFSTTITVNQSWLSSASGNFGIYTYAGGGANVASYETYTPLTFAKAAGDLSLASTVPAYGRSGVVTARVTGNPGATGSVVLRKGVTTLGTAELVGGAARFVLPGTLAAGRHALTATYAGDDNTEAGTGAGALSVAKAVTATRGAVVAKPKPRKAGAFRTTVRSPSAGAATGRVKVVLRKANGKTVRTVNRALANGAVRIALPRLAKGGYRVVVTYAGTTNLKPSTRTVAFRVTG